MGGVTAAPIYADSRTRPADAAAGFDPHGIRADFLAKSPSSDVDEDRHGRR
jgi:hypothetical protein